MLHKKMNCFFTGGFFILFFLLWSFPCNAQVSTVSEDAGPADCIYIAGNPDLYPLEYYNSKTRSYEGIFPEILKKISTETGINFVYIQGGSQNKQQLLADNLQVDFVSVHQSSTFLAPSDGKNVLFFTTEIDGKSTDVYLSFTKIAPKDFVEKFCSSLDHLSKEDLMSIAWSCGIKSQSNRFPVIFLLAFLLFLLLLIPLTLLFIYRWKKNKQALEKTSFTDTLTGIANERFLTYYFEYYLSEGSCALYYLLYLDTDWDLIRDYQGEAESAELRCYVINCLTKNAQDGEISVRLENGAFVLLFQEGSIESAKERTTKLLKKLNSYSEQFSKDYPVKFHAGLYPFGNEKPTTETALFSAKQGYLHAKKNKQPYSFCNYHLISQANQRNRLQLEIQEAMKKGELHLYLQFIVEKQSKKICGAEALTRWQNPREGLLYPRQFIPLIYEGGIIKKLDLYMLEQTCRQLCEWKNSGYGHLMITCNFSRITLSDKDFIAEFTKIVSDYDFDHQRLWMEITEDSFSDNDQQILETIRECKRMGFVIVLDDFGSGYSSLRDLCDYPIDCIKIDHTIIQKSVQPRGMALINGICRLAHDMDLRVLFEGVETEEENQAVDQASGEYIQGFYYSHPLPREHAMSYFKAYTADR